MFCFNERKFYFTHNHKILYYKLLFYGMSGNFAIKLTCSNWLLKQQLLLFYWGFLIWLENAFARLSECCWVLEMPTHFTSGVFWCLQFHRILTCSRPSWCRSTPVTKLFKSVSSLSISISSLSRFRQPSFSTSKVCHKLSRNLLLGKTETYHENHGSLMI